MLCRNRAMRDEIQVILRSFVFSLFRERHMQSILRHAFLPRRLTIFLLVVLLLPLLVPALAESPKKTLQNKKNRFVIKVDGKCGYINAEGQVVIHPQYYDCHNFSEGLAKVWSMNWEKCGFIDTLGSVVLPIEYTGLGDFHEGLATVIVDDSLVFVDKDGKIAIAARFDSALNPSGEFSRFSSGLAPVKVGDKWGFINYHGQFVIEPQFDGAGNFREGFAIVSIGDNDGIIDRSGHFIVNPIYPRNPRRTLWFGGGFATVKEGDSWGAVDTTGHLSIPPQFSNQFFFQEGLACVSIRGCHEDENGRLALNPLIPVDSAKRLRGLMELMTDVRTLLSNPLSDPCVMTFYGFINIKGELVIPCQFRDAKGFSEGLAAVLVGDKWGYIDRSGKMAIRPQFDDTGIWGFHDGMDEVKMGGENGKWGYIDRQGKIIINPRFEYAGDFEDGLAKVWLSEGTGYIDKQGRWIWSPSK